MQWPAGFLICCWNKEMAGVNTAAQPQHKTLTYNYFHKFKGLIKLCVQLVKKGKKGDNCKYIQCNKQTQGALPYTYKTNGRNHILQFETHKDAAAFKCVCCLIRHNRCRVSHAHNTYISWSHRFSILKGGGLMFYLITMPIIRSAQKLQGYSTHNA
jgi:hypothetical protein